ncbi:H+-ATPase G subunit-domain-containing protein [Coemansia spiralis]|uniref:V-type proton ATPase subunit G n=1 Tax=Coemansia umbellata TaxID=1424467 RepID=A0ABQ8PK52_9FUNG|nr:H+-ATPase G subunit-domain-containing protein [Coemansia spiralis]KAJ1990891.1 hypothetical protein EDC05_003741 [Coemansia umbellata]
MVIISKNNLWFWSPEQTQSTTLYDISTSNSQGIQTLLEAEKNASKTVEQARLYRGKRLNDARSEAAKEIAELQEQKNKELEKIQLDSIDQTALTETIEKETAEKIKVTLAMFDKNKSKAVAKMVEAVTTVEHE